MPQEKDSGDVVVQDRSERVSVAREDGHREFCLFRVEKGFFGGYE